MATGIITEAFVNQWGRTLTLLSQQKGSKLFNAVTHEPDIVGEAVTIEQLDETAVQDVEGRHTDTPLIEQDHRRRWLTLKDKDWGTMVDSLDKLKLLVQPESKYMMNAMRAFGRDRDKQIVTAATAAALEGGMTSSLGSSVALPAAQTIAVDYVETGSAANSNLTPGKLRRAKALLDDAEIPDEDRHVAVTGSQLHAMLRQDHVISSDYVSIKALVNGELNSWLGFQFHRIATSILTKASNNRSVLAWWKGALTYGWGSDVKRFIARDPGKRYSWRPYMCISHGAVRTEDVGVVEILCDETVL